LLVPSSVASPTLCSCTVCLYYLPKVKDKAKEPKGSVVPKSKALKDEHTMLRWKVATYYEVPNSMGRLYASSCLCYIKCTYMYYNFLG
jgi:hypothetical protein